MDGRKDGRKDGRTDGQQRTMSDHNSSLSTPCSGELIRHITADVIYWSKEAEQRSGKTYFILKLVDHIVFMTFR